MIPRQILHIILTCLFFADVNAVADNLASPNFRIYYIYQVVQGEVLYKEMVAGMILYKLNSETNTLQAKTTINFADDKSSIGKYFCEGSDCRTGKAIISNWFLRKIFFRFNSSNFPVINSKTNYRKADEKTCAYFYTVSVYGYSTNSNQSLNYFTAALKKSFELNNTNIEVGANHIIQHNFCLGESRNSTGLAGVVSRLLW